MTTTAEKTGKGKYGDRESVTAYAINHAGLREAARRYLTAVYDLTNPDDLSEIESRTIRHITDGEWVALKVKDDGGLPGRDWVNPDRGLECWAVICSEGVGYVPTDYSIYEMPIFTMLGESRFLIGRDVLESLIMPIEVDLADFVRTFGDRLEGNFSLWAGRAA
jgi:hypothetical protein